MSPYPVALLASSMTRSTAMAPMIRSIDVGLPDRATSSWFSMARYVHTMTERAARNHPMAPDTRSFQPAPASPLRRVFWTPTPRKPRIPMRARWTGRWTRAVKGCTPAAYMWKNAARAETERMTRPVIRPRRGGLGSPPSSSGSGASLVSGSDPVLTGPPLHEARHQ